MRAAVLRRLRKEEKGFTLIELLAVIVILGVIAAIAIPLIGNVIDKSKKDSDVSTARQIYDAARLYVVSDKNGEFPKAGDSDGGKITLDQLQKGNYLDLNLVLPSTKTALNATTTYLTFDAQGNLATVVLNTSATDGSTDTKVKKTYTADEVISSTDKESTAPSASPSAS